MMHTSSPWPDKQGPKPSEYGVHPEWNKPVPLFVDNDTGNTWVARVDLHRIGYDYVTPTFTGPIHLNNQWWEVVGYGESVYAFWIRPIETEGFLAELPITEETDAR